MESVLTTGKFPKVILPLPKERHIIVMPVNSQGILDLTTIGRRFQFLFKKSTRCYRADCYWSLLTPGEISVYEENGYTIYFVCYKSSEVGTKTSSDEQAKHLATAISKMLKAVETKYSEPTIKFFSPPMAFAEVQQKILTSTIGATWHCIQEEP